MVVAPATVVLVSPVATTVSLDAVSVGAVPPTKGVAVTSEVVVLAGSVVGGTLFTRRAGPGVPDVGVPPSSAVAPVVAVGRLITVVLATAVVPVPAVVVAVPTIEVTGVVVTGFAQPMTGRKYTLPVTFTRSMACC